MPAPPTVSSLCRRGPGGGEARAVSRDILTSESNVGAAGVFAVETRASPLPPTCPLELETKVHPKIRNHGEGPYQGLLLVESGYYCFHI